MAIPTMSTYDALEKQQQKLMDQIEKNKLECINCPTCGSQWFTEIKAQRYQLDHNIILGQAIPTEPNTIPYLLLKCIRCENLLEPKILHNTRDVAGGKYDNFLDTIEGKFDTRETPKTEEKVKDEIPSQKL